MMDTENPTICSFMSNPNLHYLNENENYLNENEMKKEETEFFNIYEDSYIETPWNIINSYFEGNQLKQFVRHQIESYNHLISEQLPRTIDMFNPVHIVSEHDYNVELKKHRLEINITFDNFNIFRPQIHENNGSSKLMFPHDARLRNFYYASSTHIDLNIEYIVRSGEQLDQVEVYHRKIPNVHIGKFPIMLKSNICVLNQYKHFDHETTGECKFDAGGYFIVNGSEKTVLGQERAAENRVYCYNVEKNDPKHLWKAEIKSVPSFKCISPKQIAMYMLSKNNGFGYPITIEIPRIKQQIPLFIVFRALGVMSDRDICETIVLDIEDPKNKILMEALHASIVESNKYIDQEECMKYITNHVSYMPLNMDKETGQKKKHEFAVDILNNDLFPHCQTKEQKIYFLGYMAKKIIMAYLEIHKQDDRDSYINKRIDSTGVMLNNLYRNYFNKVVKDMQSRIIYEINNGSWKSNNDYVNIINLTNIYKIIKSATIENGLKTALSTGNFGIKHINSNKVGVAQVYNRLNYVSSLSHARRISTPIDKNGKLVPPRKLHSTTCGYICPAETPEGPSVGIVKNLAYMTHMTIGSSSLPIYECVLSYILKIEDPAFNPVLAYKSVKVFINGAWIGIAHNPEELYVSLKEKKTMGIINIYTSIIFDVKNMEIRICNDAGRLTRPMLRVKNQRLLINKRIISQLKNGELTWNDLLTSSKLKEAVLEYIDPEENSMALIATTPSEVYDPENTMKRFTICEIHPSTMFGVLASCIPFPEHNQSPRNTYQCAQGKQAMGVYVTNYENRMDKTAYVLNYPMKPLVETRIMNLIQLNKIPSGSQLIVAIMTHTGYNQEDSLLINQGSIDRGMALITLYHTEKDEDKQKINGDEEIRGKPNANITSGMKMGNYDKINSNGVIDENVLVENRDVIIAKYIQIKENKNKNEPEPEKTYKYEDLSKVFKTTEETYVDKNYIDRNGDGYNFAKVRTRVVRKPDIGDKFCALPTQQVLTNDGWIEIQHINIHKHKVCTLDANGHMCYEYPSAKFIYDHNDKLYSVKNKYIEIVCTLNHKLYVKHRFEKNYKLVEAQHVMGKNVQFQKAMQNVYPDTKYSSWNNSILMDDWNSLLGLFIADGTINTHTQTISIRSSSFTKSELIAHIFRQLQIQVEMVRNSNEYVIHKRDYGEIYNALCEHKVGLPNYVWSLSEKQSRHLLHVLLSGDDSEMHYKGSQDHVYKTKCVILANDISRLAVHCGYSGIIIQGLNAIESVYETYFKVFITTNSLQNRPWINKKTIRNRNNRMNQSIDETETEQLIDYHGKVYCIEMPTSHLYYSRESDYSPPQLLGNSSRHGQKGTVGNIIPECDMPYTQNGVRPDIIINPHAIPSRMTIGQLKETVLGKVLVELGLFGDGTAFGNMELRDICDLLLQNNYEMYGNELLYDGLTGQQVECSVFMGPVFYQRLKHMVKDKAHSRSNGPTVNLTRQPLEGRSRDGGLRFGEMERDCMVSHGAARFTRGRLYDASDKYSVHVCKKCGLIASFNNAMHIHLCRTCDNRTDFAYVEIPYACKLLFQELNTMNIAPRLITEG